MNQKMCYSRLFLSTFTLSAFTFGGGYVIVPLMQKKFVEEYGWIDENEMMDIVAISQSAPGPIAVDASILVGYRLKGIPGALVALLATVLPPLITLSIVSFFYQAFQSNRIVQAVLKGMQGGIAAVVADVVISGGIGILKQKSIFSTFVLLVAFCTVYFLNVNVILVIVISGLLGIALTLYRKKRKEEGQ